MSDPIIIDIHDLDPLEVEIADPEILIEIVQPSADIAPGGGGTFVFDQSSPASTWTIAHGLGFYPAVTTVDSLGRVFEAEVTYVDPNTVTVQLTSPASGQAFLS